MAFQRVKPLAFKYYYIPVLTLGLAGLANMIYLGVSHYRVYNDIGYESFCAISRSLNCDTVSQSPYSIFLGMPVPVWGILGYLFICYTLLLAGSRSANRERMWPLLFWVSLGFSIYSLFLAVISAFIIHSYCLMCMVGYLVNFGLLYYAWFVNNRFGNKGLLWGLASDVRFMLAHRKTTVAVVMGILVFSTSGPFWFPTYWELKRPESDLSLPRGVTETGHPWIGAENPKLVIHEFTDYLCFQCKKMHYYLRRLIETYPEKIRLVHRHFPMDHQYNPLVQNPYHVGSGKLAILSIHAKHKDKFWEANDYFYRLGSRREPVKISSIASTLELSHEELLVALNNKEYLSMLFNDIEKGMDHGIKATPTYLVNDKLYQGQIPSQVLTKVLN